MVQTAILRYRPYGAFVEHVYHIRYKLSRERQKTHKKFIYLANIIKKYKKLNLK